MMSAVRVLVLGALERRGVAHGYQILTDLKSWRVETWTSVKPGSIYHALSQLEAQDMIKPSATAPGAKLGPARTEYSLTAEGKQELTALIEAALKSPELEQQSAGIALMEMLPRERVIALLEERLKTFEAVPTFLRTLPIEPIPSEPSKHPELIALWCGYFEAMADSTQKLLAAIKAGNYKFSDEEREP
jgi:DNA-binding PadR family transcriptional regulator